MNKIVVATLLVILFSISIPSADALKQVAGKIVVELKPGESDSFEWGLLSDKPNTITTVELSAEGDGSEFLSFEKTMQIQPSAIIYVPVTVNIPADYPGNIELQPHLIATEFGEQGGATVMNIRMLKIVDLSVAPNDDPSLWVDWDALKSEKTKPTFEQTAPQASKETKGLTILQSEQEQKPEVTEKGGGCLIATATFGSELSPQVQMLREIRDNKVLQTSSGSEFMTGFNQFYYSFSPTIADWERQNHTFKEIVKITITPMLTSLSILNHVDIDSEQDILTYGIGIISLNVGMYFVAPAILILKFRNKKSY